MPPPQTDRRRGVFLADVLVNRTLCEQHYLLRLRVRGFPPSRPGQFVQLQCRPPSERVGARIVDWPHGRLPRASQPELADAEPFLRRPFSLAARRDTDEGAELEIVYRTVGTGTRWLAGVAVADELSVLGPLGNAFAVRPDKPAAALVGGGVGIPPLIYLADALAAAGKRTVAFVGVRTRSALPLTLVPTAGVRDDARATACVMEFARYGVESVVATDDATLGWGGLVSDAFRRRLEHGQTPPGDLVVYACGPEAMMHAVADACAARDVECQLALERHMACGMGTCQSCVVKRRDDSEKGWSFALCCTDGPVFDARDILWD